MGENHLSVAARGVAAVLGVLVAATAALPQAAASAEPVSAKPAGGHHYLVAVHSGHVLMAETRGDTDRRGVLQASFGEDATRQWRIVRLASGWGLVNRRTGKCAAVPGRPHGRLLQLACGEDGVADRRAVWEFSDYRAMRDGDPVMLRSRFNGQCMDVYGGSRDEYAVVQHYACHGDAHQRFRVVGVPAN
ncbi:RICIN domain-containing protein [Spongiactinospora sp. 9N601]|uniref:RICIN domain-containing protein n=1 Tax=Spongiactinospora sp. 9N601 TaxID=3375149 RepID=UPI0037975C61